MGPGDGHTGGVRPTTATVLVLAAVAVAATSVLVAAPSTRAVPAPPAVSLSVTGTDDAGHARFAGLSCRGSLPAATGFLRPRARAACAAARRIAGFLASRPPRGRICTLIYGGRDSARVRGRIGARPVDRRFSRRDGCEIADWATAQGLLYRPMGAPAL